jgi:AAA domain/DnaB-like helicase N terminal domain
LNPSDGRAPLMPVHNLPLERAILGAPLQDPELLAQILAVPTEAFFDGRHRVVHTAMRALQAHDRPVDVVTIVDHLRTANDLEVAGGPALLAQLFEEGIIPSHLPDYIRRLLDHWKKRRWHQVGLQVTEQATNGATLDEISLGVTDILRELSSPNPSSTVAPLGIGAGDFLAQDFPVAEVYIDGLLSADGSGFIAGEEKTYKTWSALEEACGLVIADAVFGRFKVPAQRRVLFIQEEDSPRRTQTRLAALLRGREIDPQDDSVRRVLNRWLRIEVWSGFSFDQPAMVARLEAALAAFQPQVCYIDVLRKVTAVDLNKADQAGAVLGILDVLRRRHGCVFRVLHHYRKVQGFRTGRGSQELGGSFVLGAWAESSMFFEPIGRQQGAVRVSVQTKDGAPVPPFRLSLVSEGPSHAPTLVRLVAEDDDEKSGEAATAERVFGAIASLPPIPAVHGHPGVSVEMLAVALKVGDKTIRRAIEKLEPAGRVVVAGHLPHKKVLYAVVPGL